MGESEQRGRDYQFLVSAAAFVVVIAGMRAAQEIVVPFLVGAFMAALCLPAFNWLMNRRVPAALSLLIVIGVVVIGGMFVVVMVGSSANDFARQFPTYQQKFLALQQEALDWLVSKGFDADKYFKESAFDVNKAFGMFASMMGSVSTLLGDAFVIFLIFVFILLEAAVLKDKLAAIGTGSSTERMAKIEEDIRRYIAIKTAVSLLTGGLVAIWLAILGVDYPILWGLLAFLFNFVPNIGSIIAAVPAVVLALVQLGLASACYVAIGYLVVNAIVGNVLEPRVMGSRLGLSTLVVFLSLVFWGWVLGPIGMILSVPLTMLVKIVLSNSTDLQWIAILLDSKAPAPQGDRIL